MPKKMLIVGFDGPLPVAKAKMRFDGKKIVYKRPLRTTEHRRDYFIHKLLPWLVNNRGISLECFEGDTLWGANKDKIGIRTIG